LHEEPYFDDKVIGANLVRSKKGNYFWHVITYSSNSKKYNEEYVDAKTGSTVNPLFVEFGEI
jgi:hypothetical protein